MSTAADMPLPSAWRYVASASNKLSSVKGYLGQSAPLTRVANAVGTTTEQRQTWRAWASQKIHGKGRTGRNILSKEVLTLFPGWAARRYPQETRLGLRDEPIPFEVEVFVSGYAISTRSREQASRSQRAFIRLAKSFASLPRISDPSSPTEEFVNHPSTPVQASEEFQAEVLDQQLRRARAINSDSDSELSDSTTPSHTLSTYFTSTPPPREVHTPADLLQKLHYNLETRLQPFWSSAVPSRTVRLHLFIDTDEDGDHGPPLATQDVTTGVDGSFHSRFHIGWDDLRNHPNAFGEPITERDLVIVAELLLPPPSTCSTTSSPSPSLASEPSQTSRSTPLASHLQVPPSSPDSHSHPYPHPHSAHTLLSSITSTLRFTLASILTPTSTASTHIRVPITHSPIRVISDIDDTVKLSGVSEGARAVFHNVFVKELKDGVIRGMGEWYSRMYEKGVRFHYVSNGPYGYLSVLHEFFEISKLPPGSIKLKSYAGRSLLSGLLSTPSARKRAGVVEILDSFPDCKFILIGDSGEQDLELYADLARERPDQIRAVFIRDAEETYYSPIDDPTGWKAVAAGKAGARPSSEPLLDYSATSPSTSPTPSSPGDEHEPLPTPKPRPGQGPKRSLSDTYTHTRAHKNSEASKSTTLPSTGVVFTHGPLSEEPAPDSEEELLNTPKQTTFPSLPHRPTKSATYITTPPLPVRPPSISSPHPSSSGRAAAGNDANARVRSGTDSSHAHRYNLRHPPAKAKSIRSTGSTSSSSSSYYKPSDPYSRLGSLSPFGRFGRFGRRGSATTDIDDNDTIINDASAAAGNLGYSGYIRRGSGAGSSGGTSGSSSSSGGRLSEAEKKRMELQIRVHRARTQMPGSVPLRVFRDPGECGEDVGGVLGDGGMKG